MMDDKLIIAELVGTISASRDVLKRVLDHIEKHQKRGCSADLARARGDIVAVLKLLGYKQDQQPLTSVSCQRNCSYYLCIQACARESRHIRHICTAHIALENLQPGSWGVAMNPENEKSS
jgi:hypothetical protein